MVRTALGSGMLGAGGVGRRVVAVAADAAEMTTARSEGP